MSTSRERQLREALPHLTWTNARAVSDGWDHDVLVLDERLVFRFPRTDALRADLAREVAVLDLLRPRTSVALPEYRYVGADHAFGGYPLLPGRPLAAGVWRRLGDGRRKEIVKRLGEFVGTMTQVTAAALPDVPVLDIGTELGTLAVRLRRDLFPRLDVGERRAIDIFLDMAGEELVNPRIPKLVHTELTWEHILWDPERERLAVIDFSDVRLADPAIAVAGFHEYGPDVVETIWSEAGHSGDRGGSERSLVYYRLLALLDVDEAQERDPGVFRQCRRELRRRLQLERDR